VSKTIGILGGMGSWATLKFFEHILSLSEPDEFRIIIDNDVMIPSRSRAAKEGGLSPMTGFVVGIGNLFEHGADFVTIPCNSAHYWYGLFKDEDWDILNMIEVVSDAVIKRGFSSPLILGGQVTVEKRLYSEYLPGAVYPESSLQEIIEGMIYTAKKDSGNIVCISGRALSHITDFKNEQSCDCILLGCTELTTYFPIRSSAMLNNPAIIDSSYEYAKAAVEKARV